MNMKQTPFTKAEAIRYQQEHLKQWELVLKPEVFAKLKAWAEETNETEENPYEIRRGCTLNSWVVNPAQYLV